MAKKFTGFKKIFKRVTKNLTGEQKSLQIGIKMIHDVKKGYRTMSFLEKVTSNHVWFDPKPNVVVDQNHV